MRWHLLFLLLPLCCASCTGRNLRAVTAEDLKLNWDWQTPVLESRTAFDEATGRRNQYDGFGIDLAQ